MHGGVKAGVAVRRNSESRGGSPAPAGEPEGPSGDEMAAQASVRGVDADRATRAKVEVALDGKAQFAAHGRELAKVDVAELGEAKAEIAEAELCLARRYAELPQKTPLNSIA
jgi:hypothetical protein